MTPPARRAGPLAGCSGPAWVPFRLLARSEGLAEARAIAEQVADGTGRVVEIYVAGRLALTRRPCNWPGASEIWTPGALT